MIGKTISHYRILEKLGEGGMGEIYKAQDLRLDRAVAIKFLSPHLSSDEEARKRFVQEAKAASSLDHPNICTIYEIDETSDGRTFIVMACYEGQTLRQRLERGRPDIEEILDLTAQIASGLAKAHESEIVHRDINPHNIFITEDNRVKIVDFGLAILAGRTMTPKTEGTVGTAAYMSPEQARGEMVDQRADVWSLGVVMYEMLTGQRPFKGAYDAAVIYSILNQDPVPVSDLRPSVPDKLKRIVEKAMAKDLDERYEDIADLLADLKILEEQLDVSAVDAESSAAGPQPSIAVLPFADVSPKKDQEYFCDGMAEEIINALTRVEGLSVVSRTSSFAFKGRSEDVREIGSKLDVGTILEGSVRKAGNRLRITAQLIDVVDGYHLWSGQYDRELEDVFAIQEGIARHIVEALKVELSEKEKRALGKVATQDIRAYDFYLRGRELLSMSRKRNLKSAIDMFSQAIRRDPGYALAYAGIADCYSFLYMQVDCNRSNLDQAMTASEKALELDPELAETHVARGVAVSLSKRYEEAEREFERAIELNAALFEAHYFYARNCYEQGKLEKAVELYKRACEVNPEDFQAPVLLAQTYRGLNLPEKAGAALRRGLAIVEKHLELNPDDARAFYFGANCLVAAGQHEKGLDWANRALEIDPKDPLVLYGVACVYSQLGKVQEAIDYVEGALAVGFAHKNWMEVDSDLDAIRSHPRFQALMKKL